MKLIALKTFYNAMGSTRGIIPRGTSFETTKKHGEDLIKKGIAREQDANAPAEQPEVIPDTKESGDHSDHQPDHVQITEPTTKEEAGTPEQAEQLEEMTASELKDIAAKKGIKGYKSMTKAELLTALKGDESL